MANILIPRSPAERWSQPQGPSEIDWANPLTKDLYAVVYPNWSARGMTRIATLGGEHFGGGQSTGLTMPQFSRMSITALVTRVGVASQFRSNYAIGIGGLGSNLFSPGIGTVGGVGAACNRRVCGRLFTAGNQDVSLLSPTDYLPAVGAGRAKLLLGMTFQAGDSTKLYCDGDMVASTAIPSALDKTRSDILTVSSCNNGTSSHQDTLTSLGFVHSRVLSQDEYRELLAQPWQILKPSVRRPYIDLGANSVNAKQPATPRQSFLLGTSQPGPKPSVAPLILRDWKRYGQPQGALEVDWSNPHSRGLIDVFDFRGYPRSLLLGTPATFYSPAPKIASVQSVGLTLDALTSGMGVYFARSDGKYAPAEQGHVFLSRIDSGDNFGAAFVTTNNPPTVSTFGVGYQNGTHGWIYSGPTSSTSVPYTGWTDQKFSVKAATTTASSQRVYRDGALVGTTAVAVSASSTSRIRFFGDHTSYTLKSASAIHFMWGRAPSDAEIASISTNIWQLLRPVKQRIWVGV